MSSRMEPVRDLLGTSVLRDGRVRRVRSDVRLECIVSRGSFGNRWGLLRLQQHPTGFRPFLPQLPGQQPAIGFLIAAHAVRSPGAPLLERESQASRFALVPHRQNPFLAHPAGLRSRLAADDDPIDAAQVQRSRAFKVTSFDAEPFVLPGFERPRHEGAAGRAFAWAKFFWDPVDAYGIYAG